MAALRALCCCLLLAVSGACGTTAQLTKTPPPPTPSPSQTASPTPTATPTPSPTPTPVTGDLVKRPLGSVAGAGLGYLEYLPAGYGDATPRPLLVFNHGSEQSGDGSEEQLDFMKITGIPWVIDRGAWPVDRPFVVLMPQHRATATEQCTTALEIEVFLAFAMATYDVDPRRVYLTGVSCGAFGEWDYLSQHLDEVVAAVVPFAGDGRAAFAARGCELGHVPIWAIHGGADPVVDPAGSTDTIEALNACTDPAPVDARLTLLPGGGHPVWDVFYDTQTFPSDYDIFAWLLSHSRGGSTG